MSFFSDLLENESVQNLKRGALEAAFDFALDGLEKLVDKTETDEDNEALAMFLEAAASRLREPDDEDDADDGAEED